MAYTVRNYQNGATLHGRATRDLIAASKAEHSGTGAVAAYCERGRWHHVADDRASDFESMGRKVVTIWIE